MYRHGHTHKSADCCLYIHVGFVTESSASH